MSFDSQVIETTPKDESSCAVIQSNDDKQELALILNETISDVNAMIASNTSITSNSSNDMNTSNVSQEVSKEHDSQNRETKTEHREEVKRRRTRRARKRKWHRLDYRSKRFQWSESTEQEVRRLHMKVVEHGQPLAPYNTTQFIMNEHNCDKEIDFEDIRRRFQRMKRTEHNDPTRDGDPNDEDFYSSPEDESDYLQQQFHEAYDNIHAERLSAMNKNELVEEYLQLEDRVEDLERRLKESTNAQTIKPIDRITNTSEVQTEQCSDGHNASTEVDEHMTTESDVFQQEIKRLSEENHRLRCDNERLQHLLSERHITTDSPLK